LKAPKPLLTTLVIAALACTFLPLGFGQTRTDFTTTDVFPIQELQGSIKFALNGSYTSASLQNNTWVFKDLSLNSSRILGDLKVSAENSNITIQSYRYIGVFGREESLRYSAEGVGKQTFDLGVNASQRTDPTEWIVIAEGGNFIAEGDGWTLHPDNAITVEGLTGYIVIAHFYYDQSLAPEGPSVLLMTFAVLAGIVLFAVVVKFVRRRR
jgi:hypothetical protein